MRSLTLKAMLWMSASMLLPAVVSLFQRASWWRHRRPEHPGYWQVHLRRDVRCVSACWESGIPRSEASTQSGTGRPPRQADTARFRARPFRAWRLRPAVGHPVQLVALGHPLGGQWVVEHDRVEARELRLLAYTAQSLPGEDGHQLVADEDAELGGGHEVDELAAVLVHEAAEAPVGLEALNLFPQLVDLVRRRDDVLQRGVDRLGALRGVHVEREVLPRKARSPLLAPLAQRRQPLECELARLLVAARGRPRESREVGKFRLEICAGEQVRALGDTPEHVDKGAPRRLVRAEELAHVLEQAGEDVVEAEQVRRAVAAEHDLDRTGHAGVAVRELNGGGAQVLAEHFESPDEGILGLACRDEREGDDDGLAVAVDRRPAAELELVLVGPMLGVVEHALRVAQRAPVFEAVLVDPEHTLELALHAELHLVREAQLDLAPLELGHKLVRVELAGLDPVTAEGVIDIV
mmetsp:Transcript_37475/g.93170  ORF Transcript_37475/g.93170 Transcript_37475/m.93170 type:complete len:465 (-) Transcript_37475:774-2168(-)